MTDADTRSTLLPSSTTADALRVIGPDRWWLAPALDEAAWLLANGTHDGQRARVPLRFLTLDELLQWGSLFHEARRLRRETGGAGAEGDASPEERLAAYEAELAAAATARIEAALPALLAALGVPAGAHEALVAELRDLDEEWRDGVSTPWEIVAGVLQAVAEHRGASAVALPGYSKS